MSKHSHDHRHSRDCDVCDVIAKEVRQKDFPILNTDRCVRIPWPVAEEAYLLYIKDGGRGQTLERLAQRGGFSSEELDVYRPGWRPVVQRIRELEARIKELSDWLYDHSMTLIDLSADVERLGHGVHGDPHVNLGNRLRSLAVRLCKPL